MFWGFTLYVCTCSCKMKFFPSSVHSSYQYCYFHFIPDTPWQCISLFTVQIFAALSSSLALSDSNPLCSLVLSVFAALSSSLALSSSTALYSLHLPVFDALFSTLHSLKFRLCYVSFIYRLAALYVFMLLAVLLLLSLSAAAMLVSDTSRYFFL